MKISNLMNTAGLSILCVISASAFFSLSDLSVKLLSGGYPLHEIILIRSVIALLVSFIIFLPLDGGISALKTKRPLAHLIRGFCLVLANIFFLQVLHLYQ